MKQEKEARYKIKDALVISYWRVMGVKNPEEEFINEILDEVIKNYKHKSPKDIINSISKGSKGCYGRSLRFSFQEVSYWIIIKDLQQKL